MASTGEKVWRAGRRRERARAREVLAPGGVGLYEVTDCPACGSPRGAEIASVEEVRAEVEELWSFHMARLRPETPTPQLTDRLVFSQGPPLRIVECSDCSLVYRNPRDRAREVRERYAEEELAEDVLRSLLEAQRKTYHAQAERLGKRMGRAGSVLEVGSYVGGFLAAAREHAWEAEGLDVNPHTNDFARRQGFRVADGVLEEFRPGRTYDAVAIWNCFDQLPDPGAAARSARALLPPGGLLAVRVPNGGFYGRMRGNGRGGVRRATGGLRRALLAYNNLLGFPYLHGFTPRALRRLLQRTGFVVEAVVGDTLPVIAGEWTRTWAAGEERLLKGAQRLLARAESSPWFELYARAS